MRVYSFSGSIQYSKYCKGKSFERRTREGYRGAVAYEQVREGVTEEDIVEKKQQVIKKKT